MNDSVNKVLYRQVRIKYWTTIETILLYIAEQIPYVFGCWKSIWLSNSSVGSLAVAWPSTLSMTSSWNLVTFNECTLGSHREWVIPNRV